MHAMPVSISLSKPQMHGSLPGSYVPHLHSLDLVNGRGDGQEIKGEMLRDRQADLRACPEKVSDDFTNG